LRKSQTSHKKRGKKWYKTAMFNHHYSGYENAFRVTKDEDKTHILSKNYFLMLTLLFEEWAVYF
jgi:hypothetical protein